MEKFLAVGAVVVFVVLFFVIVIKLQTRAAKKRTQAWRAEALRLGLAFADEAPALLHRRHLMQVFQTDDHPEFTNVVSGTLQGYPLIVAEHSSVVSSSERSHRYTETVCILQLSGMSLPHFILTKRSFLHDLVSGKAEDVSFADDPTFHDAFRLRGRDEDALRRVFTPNARLAVAHLWGAHLQIEGGGGTLVVHRRETIGPEQLVELFEQARSIAGALTQTA